jgi:hypothetical protein
MRQPSTHEQEQSEKGRCTYLKIKKNSALEKVIFQSWQTHMEAAKQLIFKRGRVFRHLPHLSSLEVLKGQV